MNRVAVGYIGRGVPMPWRLTSGEVGHPFTVMIFAGDSVTDRSPHSAEIGDYSRRSACPGLFRIVPARDGGICRIKLHRGVVTAAQLRAIADAAERFAAPGVEATNRANIQIRGIRAGAENDLIALIVEAGLGPKSTGADDVRNVMVSPTAGIDPDAIADVTSFADRVLARLEAEPAYHILSPKFSIQIDGGERVAMVEHPNDIWFAATHSATFAFGFAGCPAVPGERSTAAGLVAAEHAEETLFAILDLFLSLAGVNSRAGAEISRFRHLLSDLTADHFVDRLAQQLPFALRRGQEAAHWRRRGPAPFGHIGQRPQRQPGLVSLGAVPPLGRLSPLMLRGLADLADSVSAGEVRMTPWQSILLPNVAATIAMATLNELDKLGFLIRSDRSLAAMITCAGSAGCGSGHADTKADALALAALMDGRGGDVFGVHLSGCSKSCAAPRPAPVTLLGVSPGHYDVFVRNDAEKSGFGELMGSDLTIEQAGNLLAQRRPKTTSRLPEQE